MAKTKRQRALPLEPVEQAARRGARGVPRAKEFRTKFPERAQARGGGTSGARGALRRWQGAVAVPAAVRNPVVKLRAPRPTRKLFDRFRTVVTSDVAPTAMLDEGMDPDEFLNVLYSALTTYEYMKQRGRTRGAGARGSSERTRNTLVANYQQAFALAGLRGVTAADLDQFSRDLSANSETLNAIKRIADSGVVESRLALGAARTASASYVAEVGRVIDTAKILTTINDLCDDPIKQGSFTKHFSRSISLSVKISYPCGIGLSGIKWCTKTVTIAGVSVSLSVNVGYKITCCGATVWGQGTVQACATIVGIKVCAQCTATITGVAGVARTPIASGCSYGLGINANLKCTLKGHTILNLSYPFGWTVQGPCPPIPCP